jgi:hypothetical protein
MNARLVTFCAAASLLACACSSLPPPARDGRSSQASDLEATIARIRRTDPGSPALLDAQLAYAEYLLSSAPGPCARRTVLAQEQLGSVEASPRTRVMFPDGWADAAHLEYRLHLERAACGSRRDKRDDLLAAVAAARRAVELYRDEFDYRSMVIMQFDVSVALHQLGENAAALAALKTTLDMDREYGFQDDARENYKLLQTWRDEPAGTAQIAALMRDFPQRQAVFRFAWHPSDARIAFEHRRTFLEDGPIVRSRAAAAFDRRITAAKGGGWSVSYAHRLSNYDPGVWPLEQDRGKEKLVLPPAPLPAIDFNVSATGELEGVADSSAFAARLTALTDKLVRAGAPSGDHVRSAINEAEDRAALAFSPGMLEAKAAENYQIETAMWIGAKLEQGVWYEMSAPLSLPGMPQFVVQQRIDFAFTRSVPCTAGAATNECVEIVLQAAPDQQALKDVLADLERPDLRFVSYDASTKARLIVDPATLLPYVREEQIYWYASIGSGKGDALLESEHVLARTVYSHH